MREERWLLCPLCGGENPQPGSGGYHSVPLSAVLPQVPAGNAGTGAAISYDRFERAGRKDAVLIRKQHCVFLITEKGRSQYGEYGEYHRENGGFRQGFLC